MRLPGGETSPSPGRSGASFPPSLLPSSLPPSFPAAAAGAEPKAKAAPGGPAGGSARRQLRGRRGPLPVSLRPAERRGGSRQVGGCGCGRGGRAGPAGGCAPRLRRQSRARREPRRRRAWAAGAGDALPAEGGIAFKRGFPAGRAGGLCAAPQVFWRWGIGAVISPSRFGELRRGRPGPAGIPLPLVPTCAGGTRWAGSAQAWGCDRVLATPATPGVPQTLQGCCPGRRGLGTGERGRVRPWGGEKEGGFKVKGQTRGQEKMEGTSWWSNRVRGQVSSGEATGWVAASDRAWLGGGTQPCGQVRGTEHQEHEGYGEDQKQQRDDCRKLVRWSRGLTAQLCVATGPETIPVDGTGCPQGQGDRTGEGMCGGQVAGAAFVAPDQRGSCSPRGRSPIACLAPLCEQFVLGKTANETQEPIPGSAARGV